MRETPSVLIVPMGILLSLVPHCGKSQAMIITAMIDNTNPSILTFIPIAALDSRGKIVDLG
jgi:hypothetical protein